jgi:hypothetical protein
MRDQEATELRWRAPSLVSRQGIENRTWFATEWKARHRGADRSIAQPGPTFCDRSAAIIRMIRRVMLGSDTPLL